MSPARHIACEDVAMPPAPRYTVRLPDPLDALVQARVRAGTPFAVLIREALSAYLADTQPTSALPIAADSAHILQDLSEQLAMLRIRVDALEQVLTRRRQSADRGTDRDAHRTLTPADTTVARLPRGQYKLTSRQVTALRAQRARGAPIKALMARYGVSKATLFRYLK
jgi:hypothetical protein